MKRLITILFVLMTVTAVTFAQPEDKNKQTKGKSKVSVKELLKKEHINAELNVPYAADANPKHQLDIYIPQKRKTEKLPVIVYIHGGAWQAGSKSGVAARLIPLIRKGEYAGVSIAYRFTNEAQWPAQIHDCKAAIRWIHANAEKYGFDANNIGVWGSSAGAHLALMLGVSGNVPELEGQIGTYKDTSSKVTAVVNFYGPTDLFAILGQPGNYDHTSANAPVAKLIGGVLAQNKNKADAASPVTYINAQDAPVLTVHGDKDQIVPYNQALRLNEALHKAQVPSYFVTIKNADHGNFGNVADDRVKAFFDKYLRGKDVNISTETIVWKPKK
jgi:acetyl esterase/lipase